MKCRVPRKKTVVIAPTTVELTLSGIMNSSYGYVVIDGTTYSAAQTLTLDAGIEVTVVCSAGRPANRQSCEINKDGESVATPSLESGATYTFVLSTDTTINFTRGGVGSTTYYWSANITAS